jgi:hypothetical protein
MAQEAPAALVPQEVAVGLLHSALPVAAVVISAWGHHQVLLLVLGNSQHRNSAMLPVIMQRLSSMPSTKLTATASGRKPSGSIPTVRFLCRRVSLV